ncbi:MAG: hypothetical protein IKU53_03640 [Firmicutes bacterium]|nr:hypothetical protein [Bacillota bacterium]
MTTKQGVLIFIALFAIFYVLIYVVPTVTNIFTQTYIAEYGTLEESREVQCIIVRDEQVYDAKAAGKVERVAAPSELVKANRHIVSVGNNKIYNDEVGIVSYYYDGYESKITPDTMGVLTEEFFDTYKDSEGVQKAVSGNAEAGDTVFKVVDRSKWYIICWLDADDEEMFAPGDKVNVAFGDDKTVKMYVDSVVKQGKEIKLILYTDRYFDDFTKERILDCKLSIKSSTGVIINTDSIVEVEGQKGVYVIDKYGKENFVPVRIYYTQKDKTVVAKNYYYDSEGYPVETVKNYDEILKGKANK